MYEQNFIDWFQCNQTPLHIASEHGHSEVVQVLILHEAVEVSVDMEDRVSIV